MNNKIKILIAEDELPARKKISSYLSSRESEFIVLEAMDGFETVSEINSSKPDIVLLDIQMPKANGFEVIEAIGAEEMPVVIFVTAYDEYAIEAFNVEAVDYLLKPFDEDRFNRALNRALKKLDQKSLNQTDLKGILNKFRTEKEYVSRIMVEKYSKFRFLNVDDIVYISAEDKYIRLHTETEKFFVRNTMTNIESRLDPDKFRRTHRSFIVNLAFVKEIQAWSHGDYVIILQNGEKIKLARRYKSNLFDKEI